MLIAIAYLVTVQTSTASTTLFTGQEHHQVTLPQAQRWTASFQKTAGEGELVAGYFGKNIFDKILSQENVTGIRIYKAKHDNGADVFVLVGVDEKGKELVSGAIGEGIIPCPPICGDLTVGNSSTGPLAMK